MLKLNLNWICFDVALAATAPSDKISSSQEIKNLPPFGFPGISGARVRRRSTVTQPPPHELLDIGSSTQNLYRRSSVVELNRRTSVASNSSTSSRQRSSDLEVRVTILAK